ncbi:TSUP family transporter [Paracoccus aeridis]|uniref:TSUP family transporter n=1 Tax=Paracoccus aeridis TaxID=1966466 RepID=UPI0010AA4BEA|nr:TSUP family transporter [Paracoccus aeridis]
MADPGWIQLAAFWLLAAAGAWTQTLTGFALGLLVVSGATLFHLLPVQVTAQIVSVLVLVNGAMVLSRDHRAADRPALIASLLGALPTIALGYWLLGLMATGALNWLRLILGVFITAAALQLVGKPHPWPERSGPGGFVAAGAAGGIMGGLFATSGPPVIWLLYRQPLPLQSVRVTLVSFFVVTQAWRLGLSVADQSVSRLAVIAGIGAMAATGAGTWAARRFPPPVTTLTIRRVALGLLLLSGIALIVTAALALSQRAG